MRCGGRCDKCFKVGGSLSIFGFGGKCQHFKSDTGSYRSQWRKYSNEAACENLKRVTKLHSGSVVEVEWYTEGDLP